MMNYACDFSQSETEKYFEWVIKDLIEDCYINFEDIAWTVTWLFKGTCDSKGDL